MKPQHLTWLQYVELGLGGRLTRLGEWLNVNWMIYNPVQFKYYHELGRRNAPGVIATLVELFPEARRLADVGAGSGVYAAEARRLGLRVVAFEHSVIGRCLARFQSIDCHPIDLRQTPHKLQRWRFDLAYCLEVAEHLPPELGDRLVSFLTKVAPVIVFTAAPPGQGGTGHVNEQPKSYWLGRFIHAGAMYDETATTKMAKLWSERIVDAWWLAKNVMVFRSVDGRARD